MDLPSPIVDSDDDEFDTDEAAEYLGCSAGYLANLRNWGSGPTFHRKFKRRGIFYLRSDLRAYKLRNAFHSTTEY
ncbi:helix-turn-helix domain-containing protein [Sphingomonas sp.]|jgi:hypothetical protein|uniref:helix-turn-helix domain-containing protein n=1 Tax=Sphingomonas sp. TaxID=28214 RepID=UPI002E3693F2|nr:helix-turn-helix domain-containing protein [Sphingomonas sp.]HEX4694444.1 helix-turn-helix domain-containing protein [Sphingomonas sp.]